MRAELNDPFRVAVVVPNTTAGKRLAARVEGLVGPSREVFTYELRQTTFTDLVRKVKRGRFGFVAAAMTWRTLTMFASQLAAAGLDTCGGRRRVRLAALGDGVSPEGLRRSYRYVQCGFLVPGFVPWKGSRRWGAFVSLYEARYGRMPGLMAAYAYEAAVMGLRALDGTPEGLAARLAGLTVRGARVFDERGRSARRPQVYRVSGTLVPWADSRCAGRR